MLTSRDNLGDLSSEISRASLGDRSSEWMVMFPDNVGDLCSADTNVSSRRLLRWESKLPFWVKNIVQSMEIIRIYVCWVAKCFELCNFFQIALKGAQEQ